ncbi:Kinesin-like protein KIN-7D, chloroplastic [Asimina triloba]
MALICTVTPSSSNSEETHNTLKFAHRAKRIEIRASQNKIIDEKSLIKKYQHEIRCLKEELDNLKRGILIVPPMKGVGEDDIVLLKQKKKKLRHSIPELVHKTAGFYSARCFFSQSK